MGSKRVTLIGVVLAVTACGGSGEGVDAGPADAPPPIDAHVDGTPSDADPGGMATIPAGDFVRGCNAAVESCDGRTTELPSQTITISEFEIDRLEVSQADYQTCVAASQCTAPANFDPTNHAMEPVAGVAWQDAVDYCAFVGKRLPTEAEWEKAARGTDGRIYPWGNDEPTCELAHYLDCPLGGTAALPVGTRAGTSPYGVRDMAGNVAEWVADWYDANYYQSAPTTDPQGPGSGTEKVYRGGGWGYGTLYLRTAQRSYSPPTNMIEQRGFRCAR